MVLCARLGLPLPLKNNGGRMNQAAWMITGTHLQQRGLQLVAAQGNAACDHYHYHYHSTLKLQARHLHCCSAGPAQVTPHGSLCVCTGCGRACRSTAQRVLSAASDGRRMDVDVAGPLRRLLVERARHHTAQQAARQPGTAVCVCVLPLCCPGRHTPSWIIIAWTLSNAADARSMTAAAFIPSHAQCMQCSKGRAGMDGALPSSLPCMALAQGRSAGSL